MKVERGQCSACGKKTVERTGEAADGRPTYQCRNGRCNHFYTYGHQGEEWDSQPSKHGA